MENNKPHNKPDWKELASFMSNTAPDANSTDAFIKGCELVWNTYVLPLQDKNKALKIDASNWAYQCDRAKQDRNKAEFENQALRDEVERLKAEQKGTKDYVISGTVTPTPENTRIFK